MPWNLARRKKRESIKAEKSSVGEFRLLPTKRKYFFLWPVERNANKRRDTAAAGNNCPTESVLTWQRDAEGSPPKRKRG